jgi:3-mercaptopyruvate sulfurtransferase SseA
MSRRNDLLVETDWLAAHLHDPDLRALGCTVHDASLSEWAADPSLPMEEG